MGYRKEGYIWVPTRREILRAGGAALAAMLMPRAARAATFSLVAMSTEAHNTATSQPLTSAAIDSTGADLLIAVIVAPNANTSIFSDSKSNAGWTARTRYPASPGAGIASVQIWYCIPTSVGSSHTITFHASTGDINGACFFAAFSGANQSSPYDTENGANSASTTTIQPGSITPSVDNCLVITGFGGQNFTGTPAVSGGSMTLGGAFTGTGGTNRSCGIGYVIQTTATAVNPTWTMSSNGADAASIASFKPAGAGRVKHRAIQG